MHLSESDQQVGLFFQSLGINILQGYGQTECSPLISCNPINKIKIDTVGIVIEGLQVKISSENEILVKDEWVFERKIKNNNPNWTLVETKSN